jgi:phage terminase large subunit GpA-like protein
MLAAGEWRPTFPEREAVVKGFHINALYSPIGLGETWAEHAAAWDAAQGKPAKLQVFYNTRLGEVVKSERVRVEWQAVHGRREAYRLRTIPAGVLLLTTGVDVQKDRLEVQMLGWSRGERMTVVDYHVIPGDPVRPEAWEKLEVYLAQEMLNSFGVRMRTSCTLIDAGNWQHEVLNFTRERKHLRIYASKGGKSANRPPIGTPSHIDVSGRGKTMRRGLELYMLGVSEIKRMLFERLRSDESALPADRLIRFSEDLGEEYCRQLVAEVHEPRVGWRKVYDRNEALDTMVYAIAAAMHHAVGVHRMRELDWQRLEETLEPAGGAKPDGTAANPRPALPGEFKLTGAVMRGRETPSWT